jgi:simple sugar transport system ATP-binding protein
MTTWALRVIASKSFAGKPALLDAELNLRPGSVHALVGENGAGKSTLAKIAAGMIPMDRGRIERAGVVLADAHPLTAQAARAAGIGMVQQHGSFAPGLTVAENASVGFEVTRHGKLDIAATAQHLKTLASNVGLHVDPTVLVRELSVGQVQRAELLTVLTRAADVILLDEPTALLTPREVDELLLLVRRLAAQGAAIVIVTHRLREVRAVADEVTVLRHGRNVAHVTLPAHDQRDDATMRPVLDEIASAMVGHATITAVERTARPQPTTGTTPMLQLTNVTASGLNIESLAVHAGEIVGIAGIEGHGQTELCEVIDGQRRASGSIMVAEVELRGHSVAARRRLGVAHVPSDRHTAGLWLEASIATNLVLDRPDVAGRFALRRQAIGEFCTARIAEFDIRPANPDAVVASLSGGNQQKVLVARELSRRAVNVLLAAQPTRGVDFAASATIWSHLQKAAQRGIAVVLVSSDLDELFAIAHRIVVLRDGQLVGEIRQVADDETKRERQRNQVGDWMVQA